MANNVLPPGFRFHPTDVELIMYWLKRKILGKKFLREAISEVDINAYDPEDLPAKCCLKSGDREWFFFSPREKKGARAKRTTPTGFWKTTGIDRQVLYNGGPTGKIKTLIFHIRKDPKAQRTDWVMHEYCLTDPRLAERGFQQDAYVLCKIFQKDGLGPRNGAQYGAHFREEDWDEEVDAVFPGNLLLPATAEPENQNPSPTETDINMPQSTEIESLSEAGPSGIVQHLPDDELGYNDPLMSGFYMDEILPIENAENEVPLMYLQEQGNAMVVQDNGVNEIFNDLPDLDYFRDLMATSGPETEGNQHELVYDDSNGFELMDGMFMELSDLDNPLHFLEQFSGIVNEPIATEPGSLPEGTNLFGGHLVAPFQEIGAHGSGYEAAASWAPCQGNVASGHKRAREDQNSLEDIGRMSKR